ncbi:MAG: HAMP domain-containing protein [Deltaproteobacteria bacterium]|nr:HAMP domain-containing protein [Deltaproteobacteria bacterium]
MRHWTLRTKLTLWYAGSVGVISLLGTLLLYYGFSYVSSRSIDIFLREEAEALGNYLSLTPRANARTYIAQLVAEKDVFSGHQKYVQLRDSTGVVIERSTNLLDRELPLPERTGTPAREEVFATIAFPNALAVRLITLPIVSQAGAAFFVQEGVSLEGEYAFLRNLRTALFFFLPGMLGLSILSGRLMARRVLQPIETITREAQTIEALDLTRRLPVVNPQDEIGQLVGVLNSLLFHLEGAFTQMRQFTADAAHELRTPLAVLRCGMEVMITRARRVEEYQEALSTSIEEVSRLSRIVDNLFLLARADAGSQEFIRGLVDIRELVQDVYEQAELMAEAKGLGVSLHTNGEIFVQGDYARLKQLVLNLVDNAVKYTSAGGAIHLAVEREKGWAKIVVEDTGIGIPPEALPHIFARFYRVDKARSLDTGGGGLGLSICQWVAQAHGGTITVRSQVGAGSTFVVSLPLR